jgi:hypothetical protein
MWGKFQHSCEDRCHLHQEFYHTDTLGSLSYHYQVSSFVTFSTESMSLAQLIPEMSARIVLAYIYSYTVPQFQKFLFDLALKL